MSRINARANYAGAGVTSIQRRVGIVLDSALVRATHHRTGGIQVKTLTRKLNSNYGWLLDALLAIAMGIGLGLLLAWRG